MNLRRNLSLLIVPLAILTLNSCQQNKVSFSTGWEHQPDRIWIGPEYWANRLQDWKIEDGKVHCVNSKLGLRTVHLLTHHVDTLPGNLTIKLTLGLNSETTRKGNDGWAGILLGAGEGLMDHKSAALIHHSPGDAGGVIIAVNESGQVVFLDNTAKRENIGAMQQIPEAGLPDSLLLSIDLYLNKDSTYTISAEAVNLISRDQISHNNLTKIPAHRLRGQIAIAANHIEENPVSSNYWFSKLELKGDNLTSNNDHRFGPFMGVQHTLSEDILKLTAQLPPIGDLDDNYVRMSIRPAGDLTWTKLDSVTIRSDAYIAPFRIENWNSSQDHEYRLEYRLNDENGRKKHYYYSGTIKADPVDKSEIVAGVFACISHMEGSINGRRCDYPDRIWFPHNDFVQSVQAQEPDILFFTGDQIYEGRPTPPDFSSIKNTELDYLYKWYIFLWSVGDLTRDIPTVCILDDHDVYHGNIWGAGGISAPASPPDNIYPEHYQGFESHWQQDQGGYKLPASSVNMIQATQTSHLPDPYDAEPVEQDIEVYYTDLTYGRISFCILEDRKFKSAPSKVLPEAKVVNGFSQLRWVSGRSLDDPEAILLGERQLAFINDWTEDWNGADMKASISQTIFANLSTYPDTFRTDAGTPALTAPPPGVIPENYRKAKDMDSNGWPQSGRNRALSALRKGFVTMLAGDQHLGSLIHMGVERFDDAGYSFCVPAIGNLWPRRWFPSEPGLDHEEGMPLYTGKYFDGFGNRMNVKAVANPVQTGKTPSSLYDRAVGYGIVKFNKSAAEITFECWKRDADPDLPSSDMYPGWPQTISVFDNYGRSVRSWLPPYRVTGLDNHPVFKIINEETGDIEYTLRVPESTYQPGVFTYGGDYTVKIGDPDVDLWQDFNSVSARYSNVRDTVEVIF